LEAPSASVGGGVVPFSRFGFTWVSPPSLRPGGGGGGAGTRCFESNISEIDDQLSWSRKAATAAIATPATSASGHALRRGAARAVSIRSGGGSTGTAATISVAFIS